MERVKLIVVQNLPTVDFVQRGGGSAASLWNWLIFILIDIIFMSICGDTLWKNDSIFIEDYNNLKKSSSENVSEATQDSSIAETSFFIRLQK